MRGSGNDTQGAKIEQVRHKVHVDTSAGESHCFWVSVVLVYLECVVNCREIVKKYLEDNGYDGIYLDGSCSCDIEELMVCEDPTMDCMAGYKVEGCEDWCGMGCKYHIMEKKE